MVMVETALAVMAIQLEEEDEEDEEIELDWEQGLPHLWFAVDL